VELAKLYELEERVKSLADEYVRLKERSSELENVLQHKNEELGEAKHHIRVLQEEKEAARVKVDSMLAMLHDIR
jgi:chromosome segregation ATPase